MRPVPGPVRFDPLALEPRRATVEFSVAVKIILASHTQIICKMQISVHQIAPLKLLLKNKLTSKKELHYLFTMLVR